MQSERESINRLCNSKTKVSSHFLINRVGKVYRLVEENRIAWHAGKSSWGKYKNLNKNSIGIELVNLGHQFGYQNFTKKQLTSLLKICLFLIKKYKKLHRSEIDFAYLGAWNFKEEIFMKEKSFIKNGGKFIIHVPFPKII